MTRAIAEQILINDCFATKLGKKAAINHLARKGVSLMNEKYPVLDGIVHEIRIDNKQGILVLRPIENWTVGA
jgi:hypothetical protein